MSKKVGRHFTIEADLWARAMEKAHGEGRKLSQILRRLIEMWLNGQVKPFK